MSPCDCCRKLWVGLNIGSPFAPRWFLLPVLYRPMRGIEAKTTSSATAEEQAGAEMGEDDWEDFCRILDFVRLQLERPLGTSFKASFEKLLPFRERLAMPGASFRVLGGDAALKRFGGIDWKARRFAVEDFSQYVERLKAEISHRVNYEIISITEMMAFVALACSEASQWRGELALYMTDNDNVRSCLTKRRSRNPFARLLVCLVQRLEAEFDFSCHSVYIRTYHNEMADWVSRAPVSEVVRSLTGEGWIRVECLQILGTLISSALRPSLALPGRDPFEKEAKQFSLQNSFTPAPARVWLNRPWTVGSPVPLEVDSASIALAKFRVGSSSPSADSQIPRLRVSFSVDPHGIEKPNKGCHRARTAFCIGCIGRP